MDVEAMATISMSYFLASATMMYNQHLIQTLPEPSIDLKYIGISIFILGICGNFYHHYLLSKLRTKGDKNYKIPQGGLFNLVICPHYLFEILSFLGISCISQTLYALSFTMGTIFYLMGRSYATRKWYESKFEDFPKDVKALVPYIF
ncbi:3-oxo-5-alpha-steroid 4-dehydrogenase (NADP(+)) [Handroanthus impetiginosus]|uniref:3-oxo-5-alpha-steroid 4-dehydrogenase (NADP(+)) n=1 Tax=Handroanthus impetiginosus TaxID=429701 RepID=A0A2G9HIE6_9LAMI|nr:3-oxo-5-alpha-steroid 4-dehydrogenase (NADP(+)) [Handroanthus impetiginosus]